MNALTQKARFTLLDALLDSMCIEGGVVTPAVFESVGVEILTATYQTLRTPAAAILRHISTLSLDDHPESLVDTQDSGAGTSTTHALVPSVASTLASGAGLFRTPVFAISVRIGLQSSPQGQGQIAVTWSGPKGQAANQTIQFVYPAGGIDGRESFFLLLPGIDVRGVRTYVPAHVNVAHSDATPTVVVNARDIGVVVTGLPNNTSVTVRAIHYHHEDVGAIIEQMRLADTYCMRSLMESMKQAGPLNLPCDNRRFGRAA